uniref:DNA-directed RNA polymerase n=1 Tax=Steinernema glaseri TaxID=37863 RepID=A0A1I7YEI4_9BILA
ISTLGFDNGAEYDFDFDENDQFQAIPSGVTDREFLPSRYVSSYKSALLDPLQLPAGQSWHLASIKRYDVSVTNEVETVVGRALRVVCRKCRRRVDQMAGCSVIGRAEDEAYFEHPQQNAIPPSLGDFPPGSKLFVRNPLKVFRRHH